MNNDFGKGIIFLIIGVILIPRWLIIGVVLIIAGVYNLVRYASGHEPSKKTSAPPNLDIQVPKSVTIRRKLAKIDRLYKKSQGKYPELAKDYDEIINSLWQELHLVNDPKIWIKTLDTVISEWPTPFGDDTSPLKDSLEKGKIAANAWRETHSNTQEDTVI